MTSPRRARTTSAAGRGIIIALAVLFVGLLGYGVLSQAPDDSIDSALADGRAVTAPGFRLQVLEMGRPGGPSDAWARAARDGSVGLDELRGTPVVLNFWASWCDPCRSEAPLLRRAWAEARRRGVLFVGLDQQDAQDDARAFIREFGLTFPHVREPGKDSAQRWGVTGIPETFFIDRRGRVVAHVIGVVDREQLASGIESALAGRPIAAQSGGAQGVGSGS